MANYVISITVQGKDDNASGVLQKVAGGLGAVGTIAGGIISAQVLTHLFNQIVGLGKAALESYSTYERLGMSLESLVARELKNTKGLESMTEALYLAEPRAKQLLGWIQQLAIKSPFTQQGVADAFQMAMGYGFNTEMAQRLTKATIDFVAATGKSPMVMEQVTRALGQIQAKGKLAGQEVMQLTEAGVNVDQILAKAFGKSTAEIVKMRERGLIPADAAILAITESLESDFGGAAERQATSFSGLVSSLQDIKDIGLREFFTGTFKTIQPYVTEFVNKLSSPEFLENLRKLGNLVGGRIQEGILFLKRDLPKVINYFRGLVTPEMLGAWEKISGSVKGLGKAFTDSMPMIKQYFGDMWEFLVQTVQTIAPQLMSNVSIIIDTLTAFWRDHGEEVMAILNFLWRVVVATVGGALQILFGLIQGALLLFKGILDAFSFALQGNWAAAWQALQTGFMGWVGSFAESLKNFFNLALSIVGTNWDTFVNTWASNFEMLKTIVSTLWNNLMVMLITEWNKLISSFNAKVSEFTALGQSIIDGLKKGAEEAWKRFRSWIGDAISELPVWVKKILGIASPSKVFASIGYNMMAGMAKGLQKAKELPYNALASAMGGMNVLAGSGYTPSSANSAVTNATYVTNYNVSAAYGQTQSESSIFDTLRLMSMAGRG
jgi:tape measure domain-containing protein